MIFNIEKSEILPVLQLAKEASERGNIQSFYAYLIFHVTKDYLEIKSANRQTSFEQQIYSNKKNKLDLIQEGEFLIPCSKILDIINVFSDGEIKFEIVDKDLIITEKKKKTDIKYEVRYRSSDEYPKEIHEIKEGNYCQMNSQLFLNLINKTSFAISMNNKDTSLFLTGLFWDIKSDKISVVAADRNRMSISSVNIDLIENKDLLTNYKDTDIIIPYRSISFLKKVLSQNVKEDKIGFFIDSERIFFQIGDIKITSNLIAGKYYDYEKIIPTERKNVIKVKTKKLKESIMRVAVASDDRSGNLSMKAEKGLMTIVVEDRDKSVATETIPIELEGEEGSILIKLNFMLDPLQIIESEEVEIGFGTNKRDLIKITSDEDKDTIHIAAQVLH